MKMIKKYKDKIYFLLYLFIIFIIICFSIGYKIPQFDKHSDWTTLKNNSDTFYNIETKYVANKWIKFTSLNIYILVNKDEVYLINDNGKLIHKFIDDILVDCFHNRIIMKNATDTSKTWKRTCYEIKNLDITSVNFIPHPIKETFEIFLKKRKIIHGYDISDSLEYNIYKKKFIEANKSEIDFFKNLHPIITVNKTDVYSSNVFEIDYFSNDEGEIFEIVPPTPYTDYSDFFQSLDILFPNWNELKLNIDDSVKQTLKIIDNSTITDNEFEFDWNLNYGKPTGGNGSGSNLRVYFNQNYLTYYAVKFKTKIFQFKIPKSSKKLKFKKIVDPLFQLNIPKSDKDTLALIYNENLFLVYPRKKQNSMYKNETN